MTPEDVKKIRGAFSEIVGAKISANKMAVALELSPANNGRTYRRYEVEGPSGPATVALRYMAQGLAGLYPDLAIPQFVYGPGIRAIDDKSMQPFVVRLWWPRFVAVVIGVTNANFRGIDDDHSIDDQLILRVVQWIDDPMTFGRSRRYYGEHAAAHVRKLLAR